MVPLQTAKMPESPLTGGARGWDNCLRKCQKALKNKDFLRLNFIEYGLKAARRAPQFSKR